MKQHGIHKVNVHNIYAVAKLRREVAYSDFHMELRRLYDATKCYQPWQVVLYYNDIMCETGSGKVEISLEEAGRTDQCKTIRAVAAVGRCIIAGIPEADGQATIDLYCLGHYTPSGLLVGRGAIFDSSGKIMCRRTSDLMIELLK